MKKIILILAALVIFTMPLQQTYIETDAAIISKAASATAKKIAKEVIQDSALNQAIKIAADESKRIADPSKMTKEGYMMFCMDYTYKPGDKCNKPASIKQNLTDADKANIKKQSGSEIDKLITPNGKGFPKWAKFLDWFLPIWLVSFGVGALTYALDPDVQNLFDEAAYNTLVALGIISPITDTIPTPITEETIPVKQEDGSFIDNGIPIPDFYHIESTLNSNGITSIPVNARSQRDAFISLDFVYPNNTSILTNFYAFTHDQGAPLVGVHRNGLILGNQWFRPGASGMLNPTVIGNYNGEPFLEDTLYPDVSGSYIISAGSYPKIRSLINEQIKSIQFRMPYEINGFWYTDVLFKSVSGNAIDLQIKSSAINHYSTNITSFGLGQYADYAKGLKTNASIFFHKPAQKRILPPPFENISEDFNSMESSSYKDDKGNIALLPPAAFTYEDETTGEQVERVKSPTGDGYTWQKPDGTEVPEENVVPREEEEPKITPAPDGTPEYTPAPTPSNPAPEPVPLTPQQPQPEPEPNPEPTEPTNPTDPTVPEGDSCSKDWELPSFEPLEKTMSNAFPFSIPWDMQNALESAFGGIGTERPSFSLDMSFAGGSEWEISLPSFFDDWKPFTDTLLIFLFDIGIMFGIYRFMKGGNG